jgi:MFS family permease
MENHYLDAPLPPARPARFGSLWRHRDFMRLWVGQTISQFGSTVTREALPYTAILALHASPVQMGLLNAASTAPLLVLGLFAGVWVDRLRRRPLMIAADLGRALLLCSIPFAFLMGWLHIAQLYFVAILAGILTVFFNVAYHTALPTLLAHEDLVEGNSKLGISDALAEIAGAAGLSSPVDFMPYHFMFRHKDGTFMDGNEAFPYLPSGFLLAEQPIEELREWHRRWDRASADTFTAAEIPEWRFS